MEAELPVLRLQTSNIFMYMYLNVHISKNDFAQELINNTGSIICELD